MLFRKTLYLYIIYVVLSLLLLHTLIVICEKFNESIGGRSPVIIYWPPSDGSIQCYSEVANDSLLSIEDPSFSPKSKSIFFHETSCRGGIDSRQACAVEAAARVHPDWDVYLLFTAPVNDVMLKRSCLVQLLQFPNIKVARIHVGSYSTNTSVQQVISNGIRKTFHPVQHSAADIIKMLTLNKWGGVNLDLDVLVMKSFNDLPINWIAKSSPSLLASGVMRFSKDEVGRTLTNEVLGEIAATFLTKTSISYGAMAIERVLMRRCKDIMRSEKTGDCGGISIYSQEQFYPISLSNAHLLLRDSPELQAQMTGDPYTYCMWNMLTNLHKVHQNSAFVILAKKVCPTIYKTFGDEFGV